MEMEMGMGMGKSHCQLSAVSGQLVTDQIERPRILG